MELSPTLVFVDRCIFRFRLSIIICFVPDGRFSFRNLTSMGQEVAFTTSVISAMPPT